MRGRNFLLLVKFFLGSFEELCFLLEEDFCFWDVVGFLVLCISLYCEFLEYLFVFENFLYFKMCFLLY